MTAHDHGHAHAVQLYEADEPALARSVGDYLARGLQAGEGLLLIASAAHAEAFTARMREAGVDTEAALRDARLVVLDALATLNRILVDGQPDPRRFEQTIRSAMQLVDPAVRARGLCAYGEMVGILWEAGRFTAALRLEALWNELLAAGGVRLFCAYPIDVFGAEFRSAEVDALLCSHTHVLTAGSAELEGALERAMGDVLGPSLHGLRHVIGANHEPAWAALPKAEAVILWLRSNLPQYADDILGRARHYYRACA